MNTYHLPTKSIDLTDNITLGQPPDGGIAGHLADAVYILGNH